MGIALQKIWQFSVSDFAVLARPDVPGLYILNPTATTIWGLARAGLSQDAVVREYARAFNIGQTTAVADVQRTLSSWESGLLAYAADYLPAKPSVQSLPSAADAFFTRDYLAHGKNIRVVLHTPELYEEIAPRLEALPAGVSTPDITFHVLKSSDAFCVFRNGLCVCAEKGLSETRVRLLQEIVTACLPEECLAIFHAGACGTSARCVIFPASSFSGKTTLGAVLMSMGIMLYADDSVLLQRNSLSVPLMPFALTVREGSWDLLSPRFPSLTSRPIVSRYGQQVRFLPPVRSSDEAHSARVAAIVFVRYAPDAPNEIRPIDTLQTLLQLNESGFWVAHDQPSIRAFLDWLQAMPCYSLVYSDVEYAARMVQKLLV